jgi:hypothetical protein
LAVVVIGLGILAGCQSTSPEGLSNETPVKEDFSNPNSGWDTYNTAVVTAEYVNDAYRMRLKKPHQLRYSFLILNKSFSGVSVEVDVTNSGTPGPVGVQCLHGSSSYDFVIRTETAEYFIGKFSKTTGEKLLTRGENAAVVRSGTKSHQGTMRGRGRREPHPHDVGERPPANPG